MIKPYPELFGPLYETLRAARIEPLAPIAICYHPQATINLITREAAPLISNSGMLEPTGEGVDPEQLAGSWHRWHRGWKLNSPRITSKSLRPYQGSILSSQHRLPWIDASNNLAANKTRTGFEPATNPARENPPSKAVHGNTFKGCIPPPRFATVATPASPLSRVRVPGAGCPYGSQLD
ncbi:unnamed protein product, partial [Iphiclides podalirius]